MELHLRIVGFVSLALGMVHVIFPKYFDWKNDLRGITLINRQLMHVHTFFVAFAVFLVGLLCVCCTEDLVHTPLGKKVCLGLGIFWGVRLLFQFFVYSSTLWKGKRFETLMHILFTSLWSYFTGVFLYIYFR